MENSRDSRHSFLVWLDDFDAVPDENAMLAEIQNCSAMLPPRYCDSLGLPHGSTYRDGVRVVLSTWSLDAYSYPN